MNKNTKKSKTTTRKIEKIKTDIKDFSASVKKLNLCRTSYNSRFLLKWQMFKSNFRYYIPYTIREWWYQFKCFFKPCGKKYRAAIPNTWVDVCVLIEEVNFAFVKGFYEDEYQKGIVDWENSGREVSKFAKWLEKSYQYITVERPQLQKDLDAAYPPLACEPFTKISNNSYEKEYAEVHRIEKLIQDKDTKVLTEIIKYRQYFWT